MTSTTHYRTQKRDRSSKRLARLGKQGMIEFCQHQIQYQYKLYTEFYKKYRDLKSDISLEWVSTFYVPKGPVAQKRFWTLVGQEIDTIVQDYYPRRNRGDLILFSIKRKEIPPEIELYWDYKNQLYQLSKRMIKRTVKIEHYVQILGKLLYPDEVYRAGNHIMRKLQRGQYIPIIRFW